MKVLTNGWIRLAVVLMATATWAACDSAEDGSNCDVDFQIEDLAEGDGAEAVLGRTAVVDYEGFLCDPSMPDLKGAKFDSSVDRGQAFSFVVGAGRVIEGWDEGVPGMKVGGRRRLIIPPDMAYGSAGSGGVVPPNATLIFDVELLSVN